MKLLLLGDVHLRAKAPRGRKDDFVRAQRTKFAQAVFTAQNRKCAAILQAGDLFDSPRPAYQTLEFLASSLENAPLFLSVMGQHDSYYHQVDHPELAPAGFLDSAKLVQLLSAEPYDLHGENGELVQVWGASFGVESPKPLHPRGSEFRILVAHASVGEKLFPGHEISKPGTYLRHAGDFDLVLMGDFHYPFESASRGRTIINVGAMVRLANTKRDRDLVPSCIVYDTNSREYERIELPHEPADQVFREQEESTTQEMAPALQEFLVKLRETEGVSANFRENLRRIVRERECSHSVRMELSQVLEAVGEKK